MNQSAESRLVERVMQPCGIAHGLTADDLQKIFNVSDRTVANWVADKRISFFKKGRVVRFSPEAVLEFIAVNTIKAKRSASIHISEAAVLAQIRALLVAVRGGGGVVSRGSTEDESSNLSPRSNFNQPNRHVQTINNHPDR